MCPLTPRDVGRKVIFCQPWPQGLFVLLTSIFFVEQKLEYKVAFFVSSSSVQTGQASSASTAAPPDPSHPLLNPHLEEGWMTLTSSWTLFPLDLVLPPNVKKMTRWSSQTFGPQIHFVNMKLPVAMSWFLKSMQSWISHWFGLKGKIFHPGLVVLIAVFGVLEVLKPAIWVKNSSLNRTRETWLRGTQNYTLTRRVQKAAC